MVTQKHPGGTPPDLYKRIRELEPDANRQIVNQHVVSKVVLKGFAAPGHKGQGWQLTPFDLRLGREQRARGLSGCGKILNFLTFASESAERVWKSVEDRLDSAIKAARAGNLHSNNAQVEAIKDGIALHLVRSPRYLELHQAIVSKTMEDVRRETLQSRMPMLRNEFRRRYGLEPAGREALEVVLDEPLENWRTLAESGAIARVSMESMYHRIRAILQPFAVEVWHIPSGLELLISESPAFTIKYLDQGQHMQLHVAVGDANCVAMPMARNCLLALGATPKVDELLPNQVRLFNHLQVAVAYDHVYYRPGSSLKTFVEGEMSTRGQGAAL